MQHPNKEEYLKLLRDDQTFKDILSKATDDAERRMIKAYTEDFYLKFYDNVFLPLNNFLNQDPESLNKTISEMNEDLIKSGSQESQ